MWSAHILTLFPEVFPGTLGVSVIGRALEKGLWSLHLHNIRSFASPPHFSVDDTPFGGGAGMVLRADILEAALQATELPKGPLIYLSPSGTPFSSLYAKKLSQESHITLLCGRYEGVDQRAIEAFDMHEVSIGDYILAGGEVAAMAVIESCVRLLPGVLGNTESAQEESFTKNKYLLDHAHFTRPRVWNNRPVPETLMSGNHQAINAWRRANTLERTKHLRPDLWKKYTEQQ